MTSILIENAAIITPRSFIPEGFIYIDEGVIKAYGAMDQLADEYTFAELVIKAHRRIVAPGVIIGLTEASRYPLIRARKEKDRLSLDETYALSMLSIYEALLHGVTCIVSLELEHPTGFLRAVKDSGIRGAAVTSREKAEPLLDQWHLKGDKRAALALYAPEGKAEPLGDLRIYSNRVGSDVVVEPEANTTAKAYVVPKPTPTDKPQALLVKGSRGLNPALYVDDPLKASDLVMGRAGQATPFEGMIGEIKVGASADIVVYDASRPPAFPAYLGIDRFFEALCAGLLRAETVIVAGEVVVDAGQPLYIEEQVLEKAVGIVESA